MQKELENSSLGNLVGKGLYTANHRGIDKQVIIIVNIISGVRFYMSLG